MVRDELLANTHLSGKVRVVALTRQREVRFGWPQRSRCLFGADRRAQPNASRACRIINKGGILAGRMTVRSTSWHSVSARVLSEVKWLNRRPSVPNKQIRLGSDLVDRFRC
jgi:hypothetical protein